jgi:hypothetical protein
MARAAALQLASAALLAGKWVVLLRPRLILLVSSTAALWAPPVTKA